VETRIIQLNKEKLSDGKCVIYFVSRDIRVNDNFALLAAQQKATEHKMPLIVCFALDTQIKSRSKEHFEFLLDGLEEFSNKLEKLNIKFILRIGSRQAVYQNLINELNPIAIYFDFCPLNRPRAIQKNIAKQTVVPVFTVDAHNIIPAWILSSKEEFAAHTIRYKVTKLINNYFVEPTKLKIHKYSSAQKLNTNSFSSARAEVNNLQASGTNITFKSGENAAHILLNIAVKNINLYALYRNDPTQNAQTNLSPYLHYGFISSLRVVLELSKLMKEPPLLTLQHRLARSENNPPSLEDSVNALIEEIVVRKELAENYCFYNSNYNNILGAKPWALSTLTQAELDTREHIYSITELENCLTADPAWNAAQNQMRITGKMHGYMRMYWAKKILEWSVSPEQAIKTANFLNDKYSIDGGDPNGYTGVAWSIMGIHDRPWFDRPIFGKIRYMNYEGLKKKLNVAEYQNKWIKPC
jgi:deoxyribodipyrimidine photo-lyase